MVSLKYISVWVPLLPRVIHYELTTLKSVPLMSNKICKVYYNKKTRILKKLKSECGVGLAALGL